MKLNLFPAFAVIAVTMLSFSGASAQNQGITPEMIRQAQAAGSNSDMSQGLAGSTSTSGTNRTRKDSDLGNLEYDRRNSGLVVDAPSLLTPAEAQRLKTDEKRIKDSVDRNSVFGRDIFSGRNLTFAPTYNLPTPANYVLASGDKLFIDLWGDAVATYDMNVSPDGFINVPNAGLINISGLTVEAAENRIRNRMQQTVSGLGDGSVNLKISLGDIRSIKVNVIGEASMPGTYTLPSLATLFNALYNAGGVSDIGSLRSVKLIRGGKQVADLDVYEYLIGGKQEVNVGLQDNDMIIVEPYANLVKVTGKAKRPRIYELKRNETVEDLLLYAGGFMGEAYKDNITINRKSGRMLSVHSVPESEFAGFAMADGDNVVIGEVIKQYANRVTVEGAVWRAGDYEISDSMTTLKQLIQRAEGIRGDALMSRTQIVRLKEDFTFEIVAIDLKGLLNGTIADITLRPEDIVRIPSINSLKEGYTVTVKGEVNSPRTLLFRENMNIEDAIIMANGMKESASLARIEVARRIRNPNSTEPSSRIAELFQFNINEDLGMSGETASFRLQPFDEIFIRTSPGYSEQRGVFAEGEFLFDGEYVLSNNNDRLSDLVDKAGGLTPEAYISGAYLRRQITEERLARMRTIEDMNRRGSIVTGDTIAVARVELGDYESIPVNLESALADRGGYDNMMLKEGDILMIPKFNNTVTISGGVLFPCTVPYVENMKIKDYVARGGGYAERAKRRPFIIYANGLPASKRGGKFPAVKPGSEIVVPMKAPRGEGMSVAEVMSLATSTVSMAAMVTSIMR